MSTAQGRARIEFEADASGVSAELIAKMDATLDRIATTFEKIFARMEANAQANMSGVGEAAQQAAKTVSDSASEAAASFDDVGTAASKAGDTASSAMSDSMGDVTQAAAKASAAASDSLSDVGGAAAQSGAAASSAMANSMADVTQSASTAGAAAAGSLSDVAGAASSSGAAASSAMSNSMADISSSASTAFASVSGSAADAAAGVASSAANMSSSVTAALSDVGGTSSGASTALGGVGGTVAGLGRKVGPLAAGLVGLAGVAGTVQAGFNKLTSIEDTTASLGIILGDLDAATGLMDKLQEDNQSTPYMFDAYAAAGKTLAAFGADLEGIPQQVQALGEAAAASGGGQEVFDQMSRAAGQAMATGKMSLDTINQLAVGGVQGLQILANHFDVPTDEMQKMISGGMVPAQEAMDILTKGILEGSDGIAGSTNAMAGVMQEMSQTTSGSLTSLVASFNNLASAGIEPLKSGIQDVANWITDLNYKIIGLINGESDLPGWLSTVAKVMEPIAWVAGSVAGALAVLKIGTLAVAGAKKMAAFATGLFSKALGLLVAHPVIAAIAAITGGLVWFFTRTEVGQRVWDSFMDRLGDAGAWLRGVFMPIWDSLVEKVIDISATIKAAWNELTAVFRGGDDGYAALGSLIGDGAAKWLLDTLDTIRIAWGELTTAFQGGDDGYGALAALIGEGAAERVITIIGNVKGAWGELTTAFQGGDDGYGALAAIIGEDTAEWAVNAIASVKDAWSELTAAFTGGDDGYGALSTIFGDVGAETIVNAVATLGDTLRTVWEMAKGLGSGLLDSIGPFLPVVWDLVSALGGSLWTTLTTVVGAVMQVAGSIWDLIAAVSPVLLPILKVVAGIVGGALFVGFKVLTGVLKVVAEVVKVAAGVFSWLVTNILTPLVSFLIDVVAGAFSGLVDVVLGVAGAIGTGFSAAWGFLQTAWDTVGRPVLDFIVGAFNLWWDGVQLVFRLMGAAFQVLLNGLQIAWDTIGRPLIDFIVAAFQMWWDGIKIIFGWLQSGWDLLWAGVRAVYDTVIAPVVGWIKDRFEDLRAGVSLALDRVKAVLQTVADRIGEFYTKYVQPLVDRFLRGFNRIKDTVLGWKDSIVGALAGAGSWLVETGKNIVRGLLDGIKSLASTIGETFLNLIPGWIKEPFKMALGIESPSKVFAEYGGNIGEGLVAGISGAEGAVGSAVAGITEAALPPAMPGLPAMPSVPGGAVAVAADLQVDGATVDGLDAVADAATAVAGQVDPALAGMQASMTGLGTTATAQGGVVSTAMQTAGAGVMATKTGLVDPALAGMQAGLAQTALTTQQQMLGTALPAMQTAGAGVQAVQSGMVDPALAGMRGAIGNTAGAFATGTAAINSEFNKVREGVAAPVRYTIGPVFNDGLVGMWNSVSDLLGTSKMNPYPVRFATGGPVRGPGGPTDDKIPALLSNREYVMTAEAVSRIGEDNLNALNYGGVNVAAGAFAADRRQQQQLLADQTFQQIASRYAGGGIVQGSKAWNQLRNGYLWAQSRSGRPYVLGGSAEGGGGTDCSGFMSGIADRIQGGPGRRQWATMAFNGGGNTQQASGPQGFIAGLARGFAIGVTNGGPAGGHTAGTIGGVEGMPAVNVEAGGSPSLVKFGAGAVGADHSQFFTRYHLPLGADGAFVSGGSAGVSITQMIAEMTKPYRDKAMAAAREFAGRHGGRIGGLPVNTGEKLLGAADKKIGSLAEAAMSFGGDVDDSAGMVERWRPMMKAALMKQGLADWANNPAIVDRFMKQIAHESSGRPDIFQQIQDINSGGNEAGGLGQIAKGTFAAYRDPSLPNNVLDPWANLNAMARYVRDGRPGQYMDIGNGIGYDQGGIANGVGLLQKKIVDPERVLNPRQTKAFEAWMAAGQRFDEINDLVASVQSMQLDRPEVMADEIGKRVAAWVGDDPADGSLRALAGALQSGVEWERVTAGMQKSAEAWANGDWVRVAEDKRLATPDEMRRQVEGNFLSELADELGGLIGLKGLYKAPELVGDSGLVTLDKDTLAKLDAAVATPDGATPDVAVPTGVVAGDELTKATRITTDTTTSGGAGGATTESGEKVINVENHFHIQGTTDPMGIANLVMSRLNRGLETAIGASGRAL